MIRIERNMRLHVSVFLSSGLIKNFGFAIIVDSMFLGCSCVSTLVLNACTVKNTTLVALLLVPREGVACSSST